MSDINEMARSTAHVIAAEARGELTDAHLCDVFVRGALWAMTRAAHAVAITHATTRDAPEGVRAGVERAQRAIATTHQHMLDATRIPA
jgi:hypothetical protein